LLSPKSLKVEKPMAVDVIKAPGDPQIGNLATPINSSEFTKALIQNLPAYRVGLKPFRRALEIGMAHGYLLYGPFAKLGPLRNTEIASLAGVLGAAGLVVILTICLSLYAGSKPDAPIHNLAASAPTDLDSEGWNEFAGGFLIGGIGGAVFAGALIWIGDAFAAII
jgi:photosystem I subunit XI